MKDNNFRLLMVFLMIVPFMSLNAETTSNQIKIAFLGLEARGDLTPGQEEIVTDILMSEIINTRTFEIIERNEIDDLIEEQSRQLSGIIDTATDEDLIEVGKIAAVKLLLLGSIGELENDTAITVRLVDAESGKIVFANSLVSRPNELSDGIRVLAREISQNGLQTTLKPSMEKIKQARDNDQPREALMLARKMMDIETTPEISALVEELMIETAVVVYKEAKKALRKEAWENAVSLVDEAVLLNPSPEYMEFRYEVLSKRDEAYRKESLEKERLQRIEEKRREREAAGLVTFGDQVENYYKGIEPGGFKLGFVSGMTRNSQQIPDDFFSWSGGEFSYTGARDTDKSWIYNAWSASSVLSLQKSESGGNDIVIYAYGSPFTTWIFGGGNFFMSNSLDCGGLVKYHSSKNTDLGTSVGIQSSLQMKIIRSIGFYFSVRMEYDWIITNYDDSDINTRWSAGIVL